jgi:hypothetical protein
MSEKVIIVQITVYSILCYSTLLVYTSTGSIYRYFYYTLQQYTTVCTTYDIVLPIPVALIILYKTLLSIEYSIVQCKVHIAVRLLHHI